MVHRMDRRDFLVAGSATALGSALLGPAVVVASESASRSGRRQDISDVAALTFDVFGTVVDWRGSIIREGEILTASGWPDLDWGAFADAWRRGYGPAMNRVRAGEIPWMTIDELHRQNLDEISADFGLADRTDAELDDLNRVWHRLTPWPDSVGGLNRLKTRYILATLSNGNVSLLTNMAKNAGLPWDVVLSAELARRYKTDAEVYLMASDILDLPPERIMMVAAHKGDLRAAQAVGFKTAWVPRPLEWGPDRDADNAPDSAFDVSATDFIDLARQLGA